MPRPDRTPANDRASKVARIQKANASAERRRGALIWGSAALVVAIIVGLAFYLITLLLERVTTPWAGRSRSA